MSSDQMILLEKNYVPLAVGRAANGFNPVGLTWTGVHNAFISTASRQGTPNALNWSLVLRNPAERRCFPTPLRACSAHEDLMRPCSTSASRADTEPQICGCFTFELLAYSRFLWRRISRIRILLSFPLKISIGVIFSFALWRLHRASWQRNVNVWLKTRVWHQELIHPFSLS